MPCPQPGIFADGSRYHHYLEYELTDPVDAEDLGDALAPIIALDGDTVHVIIAFGAGLWRKLGPRSTPENLKSFQPVGNGERSAPATQRDLFIWMHAADQADTLDAAMAAHALLKSIGTAQLSLPAFIYRDSRDLTGFVDGTANPKDDARLDAALIPEGQPGAGGAHVFSQKWVHDLPAFHGLQVEDQERVVGRTKDEDVELEGDAMPADSHVSRTDVKVNGVAQKIFRRSAPYGDATEHGLYFLAFACDPGRIQIQLDRMYGVSGDGLHDRLTDFSHAVTGSYWFAPDMETLSKLVSPPASIRK